MKERLAALRERHAWLDHVLRMQEHYGTVKAGQQAGAVTYFAFLSFFPILALAFFVVGIVSNIYPEARDNLITAIDSVLPNIVGNEEGEISLSSIRSFSGWAAVLGVLGVLYSGLAWVSALRDALMTVFETPVTERPSFVLGKLRDLVTLAVIGLILVLSVAVAGFVSGFSTDILDYLGLDGYNRGDVPGYQWTLPSDLFDRSLEILTSLAGNHPVLLTEVACAAAWPGRKASWIRDLRTVIANQSRIEAFLWYQAEDRERDWRFNTTDDSARAFRNLLTQLIDRT